MSLLECQREVRWGGRTWTHRKEESEGDGDVVMEEMQASEMEGIKSMLP